MGSYTKKTQAITVGRDLRVLLVIPVYNHGSTLRSVVEQALSTGYPVLVVDDGSRDGGVKTLGDCSCQIHQMGMNCGKGAAILAGASIAADQGYEAIVTIDADGQHDPQDALLLINETIGKRWPAIVLGAREMVQDTVPGASHFGRAFSNFWVHLECGADLSDTQSGLRLYPVQEMLALQLNRCRYDFEIEVLVKSVWAGVTVRSIPVSVHYPPARERISHFHKLLDNWRLTRLHTALVCRRLLPLPHKILVATEEKEQKRIVVKKPLQTLKKFCSDNSSPFLLAVAVWLGIFMGALPLLAVHTVAIIYVAHRLHLNSIAAVAASQFCMPPVVPALCIEAGYFFRNGEFIVDPAWQRWVLEAHIRLYDWLLGSLVLGPLFGFVGGFIVYRVAQRMQRAVVLKQGDVS